MAQAPATVSPSTGLPANTPRLVGARGTLRDVLVPVLAVLTAAIIGSIFILLAGSDPFKAYGGLLSSALGSGTGLTESLLRMAPGILSAPSRGLAFKGGLVHIGAQGHVVFG